MRPWCATLRARVRLRVRLRVRVRVRARARARARVRVSTQSRMRMRGGSAWCTSASCWCERTEGGSEVEPSSFGRPALSW